MPDSPERGSSEWRNSHAKIQRELDKCLDYMCDHEFDDPAKIVDTAKRLRHVYEHEDFRHRYANVVDIVEEKQQDLFDAADDKERLRAFNSSIEAAQARATCLAANLRFFLTYDSDANGIEDDADIVWLRANTSLEKLYDHVSLEAKRAAYSGSRAQMLLKDLSEAETSLAKANCSLAEAQRTAHKANKKAKALQRETIAILGIFSAITLAFNASASFTTSSIAEANSDTTNIFQIAFVVSIVGFFLINILYASFAFVYRIVEGKSEDMDVAPDNVPFVKPGIVVAVEVIAASAMAIFGFLSIYCK